MVNAVAYLHQNGNIHIQEGCISSLGGILFAEAQQIFRKIPLPTYFNETELAQWAQDAVCWECKKEKKEGGMEYPGGRYGWVGGTLDKSTQHCSCCRFYLHILYHIGIFNNNCYKYTIFNILQFSCPHPHGASQYHN